MPFYEFSQNNSGGHFTVDETLCHRLVIEAKDNDHAVQIAEGLGCYWNGVSEGMDCGCCGDRWYDSENVIELPTTWPAEVYEFKGSVNSHS